MQILYIIWECMQVKGIIRQFFFFFFQMTKERLLKDTCCVWRCDSPNSRQMLFSSKNKNKRFLLEAWPGGRKLIFLLIIESVWCMFPFMSGWFVPQRTPPGIRLVMAISCWWPLRRLQLSWCSSSPWVYSCAAGPGRPRPARDPCKERRDA